MTVLSYEISENSLFCGGKKSQHFNSTIPKIITRQVKHSVILLCEPLTSNFKKGKKGKEKKFTKKSSKEIF